LPRRTQRAQRKAFFVCVFVGQNKALPFLALLAMFDERQQRYRLCWPTKKSRKIFNVFLCALCVLRGKKFLSFSNVRSGLTPEL